MLALPEQQRTQIRDELEDHLRSRVDDLLILGKAEHEAIQIAINEIGETAELAKHISTVSRTRNTPRRLIMNATLFVLAGTILAASVSTMMPSAATTAEQITANESINSLVEKPADPLASTMIDVREGTIGEMMDTIESSSYLPVIVHWSLISDLGFDRDAPVGIQSAPISAELALTILAERTEPMLRDSIAVLQTPDRLEIGTRAQFDRRTTEQRLYDIAVIASDQIESNRRGIAQSARSTMEQVAELIKKHISSDDWASLGGELARITVLNTTLVVSAPERMHNEIEQLLNELKQVHIDAQRERIAAHQERIKKISIERDRVHKELSVAYVKQHTIALEQQEEWDRDDSDEESTNFQPILSELQRDIKDLEDRSAYLSQLLMELEYTELSGSPIPVSRQHP